MCRETILRAQVVEEEVTMVESERTDIEAETTRIFFVR